MQKSVTRTPLRDDRIFENGARKPIHNILAPGLSLVVPIKTQHQPFEKDERRNCQLNANKVIYAEVNILLDDIILALQIFAEEKKSRDGTNLDF